jgi:glycosyltransferase involved in cell wall biosynthesis
MAPEFETLLVVGQKEPNEEGAEYLTKELGIKPVYLPEMKRNVNLFNDFRAYQKIKQVIKEFKPDIVHTHAAKPGALGRMAAWSLNVPVIVHTYHGHVFHSYFGKFRTRFYIALERYLAKKSNALIAISPTQKNELANEYKIAPEQKFKIIPLGLDLDKFQMDYNSKRKKFRDEFELREDEIAIGIIGRLVPVKNQMLFLEAISYILKNSSKPIKAFIVGDGDMRKKLEEKAHQLDISFTTSENDKHPSPLIFTSWRSDVDVISAGLDIVSLTSFNEGTPVSLIEAQAAQKPIVSTKVGGIQDVVIENFTALLSDIHDKHSFFENLLRLVEDSELRYKLSQQGKQHVMERYSYQRLIKDMSGLYYNLLQYKKYAFPVVEATSY